MKEILGFDEIIYNGDELTAIKTIPTSAVFFEGHYPGNPIFPGVLQLDLAVFAAQLLSKSIEYTDTLIKHIKKFRFLKMIYPGQIVTVKLKYIKSAVYGHEIDVTIVVEGERVSYGTLVMSKKQEESTNQFLFDSKKQNFVMGASEIRKYLPHRFPFAHIDGVVELIPGHSIRALKNISSNDYAFWGEEPGTPFPPLLMIEVFSQGAGMVCDFNGFPLLGVLACVDFLGNAYPGDQMFVEASVVKSISDKRMITGSIKVGDQVIFNVDNVICGEK